MENLLSPGRQIFHISTLEGITSVDSWEIKSFRRFLPAGSVATGEPKSPGGLRAFSLVQLYTDPGGLRTLVAANLRLKKPPGYRKGGTLAGDEDDV